MIKHKFTATLNGKVIATTEGEWWRAKKEAWNKVESELYQICGWQTLHTAPVGQKSSASITVSWECTMNGRAPRRAPNVIAAEKAASAANGLKRRQQREQWEKERQQRIVHLRQRIRHQVDHAFAIGKSGTEPASKYITCEHCDAPAAWLVLSRAITKGACVLDEDTIVGALCAGHGNYNGNSQKVPCARLEFFYDGVRQIAIKP